MYFVEKTQGTLPKNRLHHAIYQFAKTLNRTTIQDDQLDALIDKCKAHLVYLMNEFQNCTPVYPSINREENDETIMIHMNIVSIRIVKIKKPLSL